MTYMEMLQKIDKTMNTVVASAVSEAGVPRKTGNLANSIKVRRTSYGYDIYVDDGGMTPEQWNENPVRGVAPYAAEVNEFKPYWRRLAFSVRDKLTFELGAQFNTRYNPRGE